MSAALLYLRLTGATAVVLLPGLLVARCFGMPSASEAVAWSLAALFGGMLVVFALGTPFWPAVVALVVVAASAAPFALRRGDRLRLPAGWWIAAAAGVLFGIALWQVSRGVGGDGLFHLARLRKLLAFDGLSLDSVNEFADGGLHPGYAFPLWHGFLAAVGWIAHVDPELVVRHEASVLAPVAFLVLYEAGVAVFRSAWVAGGMVAGQLALSSLASTHGGAFASLALPATASRLILVSASLALIAAGRWPAAAAAGLALTLAHPTYALFLALPVAGWVAARALFDRRDAVGLAGTTLAFLVPTVAVLAWLLPVVRSTASYVPTRDEDARSLAHYAGEIDVVSDTAFRLAPGVLSRSGAVAVAALVLVPLAALAARRRWAAFVLGGSIAVLLVMLVPALFTTLSDYTSLSQSRRAAGFLPFAFAFAGGMAVVARLTGPAVLAIALAAGIALQLATPGSFGKELGEGGGPGWLAWYALVGAALGLAAALVVRRLRDAERRDALAFAAALLFVLPIAVHAVGVWTPAETRRPLPFPRALLDHLPTGAVVFSDLETSYRLGAAAPVYVAANPPSHVADTDENRPYERRRDVRRFLRTGDLAIPRAYDADFLLMDAARFDLRPPLPVIYRGSRYTLYALR